MMSQSLFYRSGGYNKEPLSDFGGSQTNADSTLLLRTRSQLKSYSHNVIFPNIRPVNYLPQSGSFHQTHRPYIILLVINSILHYIHYYIYILDAHYSWFL